MRRKPPNRELEFRSGANAEDTEDGGDDDREEDAEDDIVIRGPGMDRWAN